MDYLSPNFSSMALLTIDMQRDFLDGQPFGIRGTTEVLPRIRDLVTVFRHANLPVVHLVRLYNHDGKNVDLCRRQIVDEGASIVQPGNDGAELAMPLLPTSSTKLDTTLLLDGHAQMIGPLEWVVYKPRWGAFFQTSLENLLSSLKIDSLAFTGCNFPNCTRASIYEASERDFRIVLVDDAVSGLYERGQEEMKNIGVMLMKATELKTFIANRVRK